MKGMVVQRELSMMRVDLIMFLNCDIW